MEQETVSIEQPKPRKPSGAQRRKDERKRVLVNGVWCLPRPEQGERVKRGKH